MQEAVGDQTPAMRWIAEGDSKLDSTVPSASRFSEARRVPKEGARRKEMRRYRISLRRLLPAAS
jgi:hypothetical protein